MGRVLPYLTPVSAALATLLGTVVLFEWMTKTLRMARFSSKFIPMAPISAACFVLIGAALLCRHWRPDDRNVRRVWSVLAGIALLVSAALLLQSMFLFLTNLSLDIERWIVPAAPSAQGYVIGRMSFLTAFLFVLLSSAALLSFPRRDLKRARQVVAQGAASVVLALASVLVVGYWFGAPLLYGGAVTPVALPTAIGFILLSMGLLYHDKNALLSRWAMSASLVARLTRLIVPGTIAIVLFAGWAHLILLNRLSPVYHVLSVALIALFTAGFVVLMTIVVSRQVQTVALRAEQSLRESEERFKAISSHTPDHILMQNRQLRYTFVVNPQLGLTEQDMIGKTDYDFLSKEEADKLTQIKTRVIETDKPAHFETSLISKAGEAEFFDGTYVPKFDAQGQVDGLIGYFRNVTERKHAEETLRESESKFRAIIDASPVPYALNDEQQNITYLNAAFVKTFGYDLEDIPTLADWWPKAYPDAEYRQWVATTWQARLDKAKQAGSLFERMELNICCKDGTLRTAIVCAVPLGETFKGVHLVILYDITERKQAEQALEKSDARFQSFMRNFPGLAYMKDSYGRVMFANEGFSHYLGLNPAAMPGKTNYDLFPAEFAEKITRDDRKMLESGRNETVEEVFAGRHWATYKFPIPQLGAPLLLGGLTIDITERKRAEEEIRQRGEQLAALLEASQSLTATLDLATVLQTIAESAANILKLETTAIYLLKGEDLYLGATTPPLPPQFPDSFRRARLADHPHIQEAVTTGLPVILPDVASADLTEAERAIVEARGLRTVLYVPLLVGEKTVATLILGAVGKTRTFSKDQIDLCRALSNQAAIAIQNARLLEETRQRADELAALNDLGRQVSATLSLEETSAAAVKGILEAVHPDLAFLFMRQSEKLILKGMAPQKAKKRLGEIPEHRVGECMCGLAVREGKPLFSRDIFTDMRCTWEECKKAGFRSFTALPLRSGTEIIGVIGLAAEAERDFEAQAQFLETLASQVSTALENARLFSEAAFSREQLRELSRHLQSAREEERAGIAREIHDDFGQSLTALKIDLNWLSRRLPAVKTAWHDKTASMIKLVDASLQTVRRIAMELRPGLLDDLGLAAAIEWQAEEFEAHTGISCELTLKIEEMAPNRDLAIAIFRIFQETLTNVARHAAADRVTAELFSSTEEIRLTVHDNGRGITDKQIACPTSLGLLGMRERALALGGELLIEGRPGQGTTVALKISRPVGDGR